FDSLDQARLVRDRRRHAEPATNLGIFVEASSTRMPHLSRSVWTSQVDWNTPYPTDIIDICEKGSATGPAASDARSNAVALMIHSGFDNGAAIGRSVDQNRSLLEGTC